MSRRQEIEKMFEGQTRISAGQNLDHEGAEIEESMAGMLKKGQSQVEVGKRLLGEVDPILKGTAYEGKRVSRKDLEESSDNEDGSEEEGEEDLSDSEMSDLNAKTKIYASDLKGQGEVDEDNEIDNAL
jgi:hypothetical protein